ncbi:MAG TPA: ATPase, T2SS/T4P/T4SS family [Terriglobia bacterium]|nr:ATPase, T2SS/T4P/T4SS family [Terriglobia bacterium]
MVQTTDTIRKKGFLGEQLVGKGLISPPQLAIALQQQKRTGELLGEILIKLGFVSPESLSVALADQFGTEHIDLDRLEVSAECLATVPEKMARSRKILPVNLENGVLTLALANIYDVVTISEIESQNNVMVRAVSSSEDAIHRAIIRLYKHPKSMTEEIDEFIRLASQDLPDGETAAAAEEPPIIRLVDTLLLNCIQKGATDLHIEPEKPLVRTRYRIDGILVLGNSLPRKIFSAVTARLKIMAGVNIAETRLPQDGRISFTTEKRTVDIRASFFPAIFGENIVLRFLDKSKLIAGLDQLGFTEHNLADLHKALVRPYGMILATGPTGSGKTTTLYCALNFINSLEKNIMTLEDPVEYEIPLIRQAQINIKAGLTFASGLRSFFRQDPDVILVGEIRDSETAEMSLRAALTGHLVLSTMHTNNAAGAIPRLVEMGQSPHILASTLILVVAQRLFRKICPTCKQSYMPDDWLLEKLHLPPVGAQAYYRGRGCPECNNSGYRGRGALYEVLKVTPEVQTLIVNRAPTRDIMQVAQDQGMVTLYHDAMGKVLAGLTTLEEAIKVTQEEF